MNARVELKENLRRFTKCGDVQFVYVGKLSSAAIGKPKPIQSVHNEEIYHVTLDHFSTRRGVVGGLWPTGFSDVAHSNRAGPDTAAADSAGSNTTCTAWYAHSS
jgi:hypothetical protein